MKQRRQRILVTCAVLSWLGCATGDGGPDSAYISGSIYTVEPQRLWVEAIAIKDGRIVAAGTNAEVLETTGKRTQVFDLEGAFVMPGLHDPHDHGIEIAADQMSDAHLQLDDGLSAEAIVAAIGEFARAHPDLPVISVGDYPFGMFPGDDGPKELIDAVVSDRPVIVMNQGGHTIWVNSKALEVAGIGSDSEDPPYGIISRKPGTTEPLGSLHESAMLPVLALKPGLSPEKLQRAVIGATRNLNSFGITSSKIAGGIQPHLDALISADRAGQLTARVTFAFHWRTSFIVVTPEIDVMREQILAARKLETPHVKTHSVKYYVDAAPASKTAAVLDAYEGDPGNHGLLNIEPEKLNEEVVFWDKNGINAMMHSVGDQAVRVSLDAIQSARKANGDSGVRHHVTHNVLVDPSDYARFNELGAVMDFSPMLAYPSPAHANHLEFFGAARLERFWSLKDLQDAGVEFAVASDFPVSPYDPWAAIEAYHTRMNPWGEEAGTLGHDQAVDLATIVRAYTINGAYVMGQEKDVGTIEVGKFADFVVLDRNIFDVEPSEISETVVLKTVFEGEVVYEAE